MAFAAAQRANNILAAPDKSIFLLTDNKSIKDQPICKENLQILSKIENRLVSLETELVLPG